MRSKPMKRTDCPPHQMSCEPTAERGQTTSRDCCRSSIAPVKTIHDVISQKEIESIGAKYRKITGYDMETLNNRASVVP